MATRLAVARLAACAQIGSRTSTRTCTPPARQTCLAFRSVSRGACAFSTSNFRAAKKYSEDHEWVELDTDGTTGTIGISTYAAKALGDVVYVELPTVDSEVSKGDTIGAVESVKSASDLLTPVSGTIIETNGELEKTPGNINKSPESASWIAKIKVKDTTEFDDLMDDDAYTKFTQE